MGSATTQARTATTEALASTSGVDLDVARELFAAVGAVSGSSQLSGALSDSSVPAPARAGLVSAVFGSTYRPATVALLSSAAQQRWSNAGQFVEGLEELAIQATSVAESADIESELFAFSRTVASNGELELALGGRLGGASAKGSLVSTLLDGRASTGTALIVSSLVQHARGRRVRALLRRAERIVADQRARIVATVYAAAPLSAEQQTRLQNALSARYGSAVTLNTVIDPTVVGGLRVQVADDVIDASVSARLADLRQRIAG
ncbi:F-type H+-transporting ATPase subunit delta [Microbacterium testaceum]|uniref:F0F1 ATP synthase subunit delta n=1 Tax=Microbacterium TaxID=33882 RepID=UPI001AE9A02A|nr:MULTISPECIES: F0F1 ATP synthase subunit delta [Microbacterium]MDQ1113163.1 F-type H+-transporting ATPase subunit delta [Microbacterium testaceum]MDQ1177300.1 F-type H+-transporting ATPase subunit delta [Microbacterium sp. SORGH_AS_0421]MDR6099739.1 F-type H+-transporting ATPase subunit delta [Microbacterium sp. SORGH_AS_0454]WAC68070.1 F0F1 ATP synthase subunit delta [Microbacterium sp. SL75]